MNAGFEPSQVPVVRSNTALHWVNARPFTAVLPRYLSLSLIAFDASSINGFLFSPKLFQLFQNLFALQPTNTCQLIPRSYRGNVQIPSQTRGLYILHYDYSSMHLISWKTGLLSVINQNAKMGDLSHSYWINVNLFSTHNKVITCVHLIWNV